MNSKLISGTKDMSATIYRVDLRGILKQVEPRDLPFLLGIISSMLPQTLDFFCVAVFLNTVLTRIPGSLVEPCKELVCGQLVPFSSLFMGNRDKKWGVGGVDDWKRESWDYCCQTSCF